MLTDSDELPNLAGGHPRRVDSVGRRRRDRLGDDLRAGGTRRIDPNKSPNESRLIAEWSQAFDLLDAPVRRLCMDDAPVPYASSMEQAVVKRGSDLVQAVYALVHKQI